MKLLNIISVYCQQFATTEEIFIVFQSVTSLDNL